MPLQIIRGDITACQADAIVNAANPSLRGGGGVDGAIHRAAGPELGIACRIVGGCRPGEAKLTKGFRMACRYIIHTAGPVWQGGGHGEKEVLLSCYKSALELARKERCKTVAFPLISAGAYGYPPDQAMSVALQGIGEYLLTHDMAVTLVIYDEDALFLKEGLFFELAEYIGDRFTRAPEGSEEEPFDEPVFSGGTAVFAAGPDGAWSTGEDFSRMLLRKMEEKGLEEAELCGRANISRALLAKIRGDRRFRPEKPAALALAVALELSLPETEELLRRTGTWLSHSSGADIIVEYFISQGSYNIFEINQALFAFKQPLLGE